MAATDRIRIPQREKAPLTLFAQRVGAAVVLVLFVATVVRLGRDSYVDVTGDPIGIIDALYYASVTVTTTGYGDISPISQSGRLATILLITPARILFLILVVSTTVEVLTEQSRKLIVQRRWRERVKDHTIICGYGATGSAAAADLLARGVLAEDIVIVDPDPNVIELASSRGFVGIIGDAAATETLEQAGIRSASAIVVAPNRDDSAVLITLTARELNVSAHIVAAGRERENLHLLDQGGANEVIDATSAVGRMLGMGTHSPSAARVLDDLLAAGQGLELVEIGPEVRDGESHTPRGATLVGIVRDGTRVPQRDVSESNIRSNDRIVVLRDA